MIGVGKTGSLSANNANNNNNNNYTPTWSASRRCYGELSSLRQLWIYIVKEKRGES